MSSRALADDFGIISINSTYLFSRKHLSRKVHLMTHLFHFDCNKCDFSSPPEIRLCICWNTLLHRFRFPNIIFDFISLYSHQIKKMFGDLRQVEQTVHIINYSIGARSSVSTLENSSIEPAWYAKAFRLGQPIIQLVPPAFLVTQTHSKQAITQQRCYIIGQMIYNNAMGRLVVVPARATL